MNGRTGLRHWKAEYPELHDADWLRARVREGLSDDKIAELIDFGVSRQAVYAARHRHGIPAARHDATRRTGDDTPK